MQAGYHFKVVTNKTATHRGSNVNDSDRYTGYSLIFSKMGSEGHLNFRMSEGGSLEWDEVPGATGYEFDADYYELFEDIGVVYVDGTELEAENYDAWSGSTVISLKASYLDTLAVGEHTLAVRFDDGGMARATFIIADPNAPEESGDTPASADTGVFTGSTGGVVAAGVSVIAVAMIAGGAYLVVKKSRK